MKLKPMDENTLAFLQEMISSYEDTIEQSVESLNSHMSGWLSGNLEMIEWAIVYFTDTDSITRDSITEFMEAIKAYELTNTN